MFQCDWHLGPKYEGNIVNLSMDTTKTVMYNMCGTFQQLFSN